MATPLGSTSNKGTGINYTYMRYADVLLMYAEAANENHNGPTPQAKEALKKVRNRAFAAEDQPEMVDTYVDKLTSKEDFFDAIVKERDGNSGVKSIEDMIWRVGICMERPFKLVF